ncbi:MAG: response regulator transcription factor [Chloroflexi bacterium]|nr:response regulator transcription factor [Chloroflexota bacterium]
MAKIKVVLADDHAVLRAGLRVLLNGEPDIEVIDEAADGLTAVRKARELHPNVIVMDISMPGMDGLEAIRQVREKAPQVRTLVLTMHEGEEYILRALEAGASGYVLKKAAHTDLLKAIRAVNRGEAFLG